MTMRFLTVSPARIAAAFLLLFALYQSAEGVGARLLHSDAAQALLMTATLIAAWTVGRWLLRHGGYAAYALEWKRGAFKWLTAGLLLAMAGKALAIWVGLYIGAYAPSADPLQPLNLAGLPLLLVATFIPSITEDIITRGLWWRVEPVARSFGRFVALSAFIYLFNHIFRLSNGPGEWFMLICFGIAYAAALARTGSLWAAVGLHWGWNLTNGLSANLISVDSNPALTPYLSGIVHLAMMAVVLTFPMWKAPPARDEG